MNIGVCTDVGKIREINQDSYYYSDIDEILLLVVADGMGGHNAGEVASNIATSTIRDFFISNKNDLLIGKIELPAFINNSLQEANNRVFVKSREDEKLSGMGTTVTMAVIYKGELFIGHIGDSRAYLLRGQDLLQLTQDHSLVAELMRNGSISKEEALCHPQKNIITRALGTQENVKIDIMSREVFTNDIVLLCTDGLTNMLSDEAIKNTLVTTSNIQLSCNLLTQGANELGGLDNITVMIVEV